MRGLCVAVIAVLALGACGGSHAHNAAPPAAPASSSTPAAAATTTVAPTTTTFPTTYTVRHGDTLTAIADRLHVSLAALMRANHITNADHVEEGQQLTIPVPHSADLTITPASGPLGTTFQLKLTGAEPAEAVTLKVKSTKGTFTGPAHTASKDGAVAATYKTVTTDPAGTYTVTATGNQGTSARATFTVTAPTSHT